MATSYSDWLKPARLDIDPSSAKATKHFKHWLKTFTDFVTRILAIPRAEGVAEPNKLEILCAFVSADVYELIEGCDSYDTAIAKLKDCFIKTPNIIFARHLLATRKQKTGESLEEFLQELHTMSKNCNFRNVSAEEHRLDLVRDAFINGLASHHIRQRLLENNELSVADAFNRARSLCQAQEYSATYASESGLIAAAANVEHKNDKYDAVTALSTESLAITSSEEKKCYFCGRANHRREDCPAKETNCYSCGKIGHFSRVCKAAKNSKINKKRSFGQVHALPSSSTPNLCTAYTAACPGSLIRASMDVYIKGKKLTALIDSGSSESYISLHTSKRLNLNVIPSNHSVQMASASMKMKSSGFCLTELIIDSVKYEATKLNVLDNLCCDVILGLDFQSQHKRLIFEFNGVSPDLVVSNDSTCALAVADTKEASLFTNLTPNAKPIATKSRRFNEEDRKFIQDTVDDWLKQGIIQPSASPWRAQVVVVKNELNHHKKRLCVDYSQTINVFTELDAYPLPRIDDMINALSKYKVFSTFDLRSAYHQIKLSVPERKYTAFEANGKLYEFTRIPFGVKNGVAEFQRKMCVFIDEENLKGTFSYLDDITIAGYDQADHDRNVAAFVDAIHRRNFTLNESKTISSVKCINVLGYVVGNMTIKPDPERMRPLQEFPVPNCKNALRRVLGMFAYYARWIDCFADKIRPLAETKVFPITGSALDSFVFLKSELRKTALRSIDESLPFVVECDASNVAVSATLNQGGRPVAFMSRTLQGSEIYYPAFEKEATAVIEAVKKWSHLLSRQTFTLITDQRSVAFMLDSRRRTKIKNDKVQLWRMELAPFSYVIQYRPGQRNTAPDSFTRAFCSLTTTTFGTLQNIHDRLCHPGLTRLLHFVRTKNLPFSTTDVKRITSACKICAEIKPRFVRTVRGTLVQAMQPMERISIDFKGPLPSSTHNKYLLIAIDEYSRFPFAFPCKDTSSKSVIKCLDQLFSLCGTASFLHSDNASSFSSVEFKTYLTQRGISSSKSSIYNPSGNGQAERTVQTVWKTIQLALKTAGLPHEQWEIVLADALHSIRSLLCTATNTTPHERFFSFQRRSSTGASLPTWLTYPGSKAFLRRFVRNSKMDPYVDEVEIINVNPNYANVRYLNGREVTVSVRDLAPFPQASRAIDEDREDVQSTDDMQSQNEEAATSDHNLSNEEILPSENEQIQPSPIPPRRSARINKGVPPLRYGIQDETV